MSGDDGRKGRRLSRDEHVLWRGVTRSIAPLRSRAKAAEDEIADPLDEAPPRRIPAASVTKPSLPAKPKAAPPLAPLERKLKQRLSRGRVSIDARLDLHGHTQSEAHDALLRFLHRSQAKGASVVLVITGKGMRGDAARERGVLKRQVPMWLTLPEFRSYVIGFDDAAIGHGGEGALYVRLRRSRER